MAMTTITGRAFSQGVDRAKAACVNGPVFITERGKPTHVLLTIQEYEHLTSPRRNIVDALSMPGVGDIEFDPPRLQDLVRPADLSE